MYKPNPMGPWPVVDLGVTNATHSAAVTTDTDVGSALKVYLSTGNLGTKSEAYERLLEASGTTIAVLKARSFGVCLQPMENADLITNTYVDINMNVACYADDAEGTYAIVVPWIGHIDSAGASIGTGWNANNVITNWQPIGIAAPDTNLALNTQVLIKTVNSADLDTDKFVCVGFSVINQHSTNAVETYTDFNIYARYATSSLGTTLYRG